MQKQIVSWHNETFPNATEKAIENKLVEEAKELIEAICFCESPAIVEEVADVIIVASALLGRWEVDLETEVLRKLEINKSREWGIETQNGDRPRRK